MLSARVFPSLAILAVSALAQTRDPRPAYEAATAKLNISGAAGSSSHGSKGQVIMINMPLRRLLERAYEVRPAQLIGPDWMDSVRVDITAKYPPDTKLEDRTRMLLTLLEERFKLAAHHEKRSAPGYALIVAKGGLKLKPVAPGTPASHRDGEGGQYTLKAEKVSMANLAEQLTKSLGELVIDKTGLEKVYDLQVRWTVEESTPKRNDLDAAASGPTAIGDAIGPLGLRLHAEKVPLEAIVVDHLERVPGEN